MDTGLGSQSSSRPPRPPTTPPAAPAMTTTAPKMTRSVVLLALLALYAHGQASAKEGCDLDGEFSPTLPPVVLVDLLWAGGHVGRAPSLHHAHHSVLLAIPRECATASALANGRNFGIVEIVRVIRVSLVRRAGGRKRPNTPTGGSIFGFLAASTLSSTTVPSMCCSYAFVVRCPGRQHANTKHGGDDRHGVVHMVQVPASTWRPVSAAPKRLYKGSGRRVHAKPRRKSRCTKPTAPSSSKQPPGRAT